MTTNPKDKLRTEFLNIYANLPLGVRGEIISVLDKEPMTWRVCRFEVENKTKMGDRILKQLRKMEII